MTVPRTSRLIGRLAVVGMAGVLVLLLVFSVWLNVVIRRAHDRAGANPVRVQAVAQAQRALTLQSSLQDTYRRGPSDSLQRQFLAAGSAFDRALRVIAATPDQKEQALAAAARKLEKSYAGHFEPFATAVVVGDARKARALAASMQAKVAAIKQLLAPNGALQSEDTAYRLAPVHRTERFVKSMALVAYPTGVVLFLLFGLTYWVNRRRMRTYRRHAEAEEATLHESAERFRQSFDRAAVGIAHMSLDGRWLFANERLCEIYGYSREELLERRFHDITHPNDVQGDVDQFERLLSGELGSYSLEKRYLAKDGSLVWGHLSVSLVRDAEGNPKYAIAVVEDITARKRTEEALREREEQYRSLVETSPDGILLCDLEGTVIMANQRVSEQLRYADAEEMAGLCVFDLIALEDRDRGRASLVQQSEEDVEAARHGEYSLMRTDGTWIRAELSASLIKDAGGESMAFTVVIADVSDRRSAEEEFQHQVLHDALTDLPNRALLRDRLHQAILSARRQQTSVALLLLDLDHLQEVNESYGQENGDLLLQQAGSRLRSALRESDTVARLGEDEFAILLPAVDDAGALRAAGKLVEAIEKPFALGAHDVRVSASIGLTLYPQHGDNASALLRQADVAMYVAKRTDQDYVLYSTDLDDHKAGRLSLINELREAVANEQLVLHYQPKVDLRTGHAGHVEALARWHHPDHGFIAPAEFVELAEHSGLIKGLTNWVLGEAMRQCGEWLKAGLEVSVAVNLSALSLNDLQLIDEIRRLVRVWQVPPTWLEVEVAESAIMTDTRQSREVLDKLHEMGVRVCIDDFGTGHTSLSYLKQLPVDQIKIDKTFVLNMATDPDDAFVAQSIVDLGHHLGLEVVAEGVENEETWDMLAAMGCDMGQGYYLSRPVPASDVTVWFENRYRRLSVVK